LSLQAGERRFRTALFGMFGGLAMVLAIVGVYGVVSYAVWQRRPEIGLRMALGADPRAILTWLVGGMARLVVAGLVLGLGLARLLSSLVEGLLFGVTRTDTITYVLASVALAVAALATCTLVARTATRIDPTVALKHE